MLTMRTVLDDLPAADLGPTDYQEPLFQAGPQLVGDELASEAASGQEAVLLPKSGFTTMVDATLRGIGALVRFPAQIPPQEGHMADVVLSVQRRP